MARRPHEVRGMHLWPGAGGDRSHHAFVALEEGLAPLVVQRHEFAYRAKGRRPPPRASKLIAEIGEVVGSSDDRQRQVLLGGRSMGGRMCSMAVAEGLPAAGLVLLSYPLHPRGKLERCRVEHFGDLDVPCLFISGSRDPFGTRDEFEAHLATIPGPTTTVWLDGQGHDPKRCDDVIVAATRAWIDGLML